MIEKKNSVNTWFLFDDRTCQECQCCFCPPDVFWVSHLFLCYSASQSWVVATAIFSNTHAHKKSRLTNSRYIYIYICIKTISISPNLNNQMSRLQCSQLHFCPEWNDEENQGKINLTLKKDACNKWSHSIYIYLYIYICNCSLDMHNTWDEWLQQKIASSKFTVSCISLLFITSHRSIMPFVW